MKRKYIIAIALLIFLCLCVIVFHIINKEVNKVQLHSAYEALNTSLIVKLNSFYRDNNLYPDSLNKLTEIEYSDGATPEMLKDFKYVSKGNRCELSYYSAYFGEELIVDMIEGELKTRD